MTERPVDFWNHRYAANDFVYGTAPNAFLAEVGDLIPPGPVLCLAEGEGRNAVHLATRGYAVTAVDLSSVGLAKAQKLAAIRGTSLTTVVADLSEYPIAPASWSGVVAIFMHLPPGLRRAVLARATAGLKPGGVFIMECYTPAQVGRGTGGPSDPLLCPTLAELQKETPLLRPVIARELDREVHEGSGHTGAAAVAQYLGRRADG